jgi:uncharacterized protein Yka (UPF0111/DUF47 family)
MPYHRPFMSYELDAHPDGGRIQATIDEAIERELRAFNDACDELEEGFARERQEYEKEIDDLRETIRRLEDEIDALKDEIQARLAEQAG